MSQTGKYLNLLPHMQSWAIYNENGPYTSANKIGTLSPAQFGGLSYSILADKGGDVYVIQTESFGRCAIWAPRDNDSSITNSPTYSNGNNSGGGSNNDGSTNGGKFLNLNPHMISWAVYNINGPYTSANKIGTLSPSQFGGLSYSILEEKGGDIYIIQTDSFGRCAIWAPRDNDSSITNSPAYSNGNTSGGGSNGSGKYLNLHGHMPKWGVYNENGPYTSQYAIGYIYPAQFGGLSYRILEEKGGDVYVIQTESLGRCAIWAPMDNDSSITSSPQYSEGDTSGGGSNGGGSTGGGKYLNLHGHMTKWGVYNENGPYTSQYAIGYIYPAQFGGLSYRILEEKGGDVYVIQTESLGRCAIWAPMDNDSSITSSPQYSEGDTSGGGSNGGGSTGGDVGIGNASCRIYTRNEWSASSVIPSGMSGSRILPYKYIIIHNSGADQNNSDMAQMRSIQNYHQGLDWGDIGYNYCIGHAGTVMQGRESKYVGAHTKGDRNSDSIGICLFGNFDNYKPTQTQLNNLIPLLTLLCEKYGLTPDRIMGHRDYNSTSCPGSNLYGMLNSIRSQVKSRLDNDSIQVNKGLGNLLGINPYTLITGKKVTHSETIFATDHLDIKLEAELFKSGEIVPPMEKPQDPQNILDSVSGILYDILPAALTAEIESSINGIEKFEVTSGKFKIEGTTIIFTALKISTLLEFPNGDKVTESIIFDGKVSLDDLLRLAAKFVFAIAFLIVIMLTPIDELAAILTTAWTVLKPLFEKA